FLSCTNTTQIEAIADIEQALGKPVVNSNQAVLWGCVKRLKSALAPLPPMPSLGRLMRQVDARERAAYGRTTETSSWTCCLRDGISHASCSARVGATLSDAADHARRPLRARRAG